MKKIRFRRAVCVLLAVLTLGFAAVAYAEPEEQSALKFTVWDDERNVVLRITTAAAAVQNLEMKITDKNKTSSVLEKLKTYTEIDNGALALEIVVTPKATGKCTFNVQYDYTYNGVDYSYYTPVTLTVKTTEPPTVTKNPTGERVALNGSCTFVAHADNADSVQWFLTNGHDTIKASKGTNRFKGLRVSGDETDRLKLSKVPEGLDGWEVFATFTNANGTTDTKTADIYVYEPLEEESDEPYVTPTPVIVYVTPIPTIAPTPTATPVPTLTPTAEPAVVPSAEPGSEPGPEATPYNGTKLAAGAIRVINAAGQEVGLSADEAEKVTGYMDGTYVLIDGTETWLRYANAYGEYTASLTEIAESAGQTAAAGTTATNATAGTTTADATNATTGTTVATGTAATQAGAVNGEESVKRFAVVWDEVPTVLADHELTATVLEVTSRYGFVTGARLILGFDGTENFGSDFDFDDHATMWRYGVEETFDKPIA